MGNMSVNVESLGWMRLNRSNSERKRIPDCSASTQKPSAPAVMQACNTWDTSQSQIPCYAGEEPVHLNQWNFEGKQGQHKQWRILLLSSLSLPSFPSRREEAAFPLPRRGFPSPGRKAASPYKRGSGGFLPNENFVNVLTFRCRFRGHKLSNLALPWRPTSPRQEQMNVLKLERSYWRGTATCKCARSGELVMRDRY
jgi:hypothetical protein